MADESSWALTWGNLQEIFQECEQLGFCFRIHLDHLVKALGARAMTARSPQVLFLRTAWKSGASRAQPSGNVAPMATSLPHYSYSVCVCVCACFWGIDKSIHSVTWFAWLWGRAAFLVPVFALAFSLRLEPSWAKQWWHSPYISLNCTRSNWVLSVLRQPGFLLGRQHGRFTTTWEIPSKYWKRSFRRSQVQQCCTWTLIGLAPLRKAWRKRFLWWRSWVSNLILKETCFLFCGVFHVFL